MSEEVDIQKTKTASNMSIQNFINLLQSSQNNGSTNGIIQKALSAADLYTGFAELRSLPAVQQLGNSQQAVLNTLDLFSYGTYNDYESASEGTYMTLTDAQLLKLKALTAVTVVNRSCEGKNKNIVDHDQGDAPARSSTRRRHNRHSEEEKNSPTMNSNSPNVIPYAILRSELGFDDNNDAGAIRQLEDLLIHCIYKNLLPLGSKLDQKNMCIVCKLSSSPSTSTAPTSNLTSQNDNSVDMDGAGATSMHVHVLCRDINLKDDLSDMIEKLEFFHNHGKSTKARLQTSLEQLNSGAQHELQEWNQVDLQMKMARSKVDTTEATKGIGGQGMAFSLDENPETTSSMEWSKSAGGGKRQVKRSRGAKLFGFGPKRK